MDASVARIRDLMLEACATLEKLGTAPSGAVLSELAALRSSLVDAGMDTLDIESADAACGMAQAIDDVLGRIQTAAAAA